MKQRLGSLGLALSFAVLILGLSPATASAKDFQLVNAGEHTIYSVYVSRATSRDWEYPDVLGGDVLAPDDSTTISFPPGVFDTCNWDIAVVYTDGTVNVDPDEDLCTFGQITATY